MARTQLTACMLAIAALLCAAPAFAQFGSIFSDSPPRPPGNVPNQPQNLPPADLNRAPDFQSGVQVQRPTDLRGTDQPPARPLPSPMSLPPSSRPGGGTIQSNELPPPPGAVAAPPRQPPIQNAPQQGAAPAAPAGAPAQATLPNTLPGLPPGQRQPRGAPGQPADTSPQPGDEVVVEPPPQRIANPTAVFSGLDKITGRIISFDVAINETVQFGALQVTPRGLLFAATDRNAEYRLLCPGRRGDVVGRDQTDFLRLDVRGQPRSARHRASDLRCVADRLQRRAGSQCRRCRRARTGAEKTGTAPAGTAA